MKYFILITIFSGLITSTISAQYTFTDDVKLPCTKVKSQDRTGTCWSFATASFLESELMRQGYGDVDLSEMHVVRNIYRDKARNYVLRQGKANFSQGSLSHDLMRAYSMHGVVPEVVYPGKQNDEIHNHAEMENALKGLLDGVLKGKKVTQKWPSAVEAVLDVYLGPAPEKFFVDGKEHDARSYANALGIRADDYVSLTSFTHHPMYDSFILEIPDNYSNGAYYNIPVDDLLKVINRSLDLGYTIAWDGDVSEKGFSARQGIAVLPVDADRDDLFDVPAEEMEVSQDLRQDLFETMSTTDDHLMHLVGRAKDQNGTNYYIIKNSWGEISDYNGFLYMSEAYVAMKTISIMLHKSALPGGLADKLGLTKS